VTCSAAAAETVDTAAIDQASQLAMLTEPSAAQSCTGTRMSVQHSRKCTCRIGVSPAAFTIARPVDTSALRCLRSACKMTQSELYSSRCRHLAPYLKA
jgi:nucleotidyltransferase/DNA polymerase involved in DNA repair